MRFRPNIRNLRTFLKSTGTGREVKRVTERIAGAAGSGGGDFRTDSELGPRRWRGAVIGNYDVKNSGGAEGSREDLLRGLDGAE